MTPSTSPTSSLAFESLIFASRLLRQWRRTPTVTIQGLLFPTILLVTYHLLVSESMMKMVGDNSLANLVPMCALAGGMFGALGAALTIPGERDSGLITRWWTFPLHRGSVLIGRLIAEATRTLLSTLLITAVGLALGLRFEAGWWTVIPYLLVPIMVVVVFSMVVITVALRSGGNNMLTWLGMLSVGLVFGSAGVAPIGLFPSWLQPIIRYQPMSPAIESMRALAQGDSALLALLTTFGWAALVCAVFLPLANRGYRTAAESH